MAFKNICRTHVAIIGVKCPSCNSSGLRLVRSKRFKYDIFFLGAHFLSIEGRGPFRPIAVNKRGYQGRWQGRMRAQRETSEGGRVDEGGIAGSGSEVNAISTKYKMGGKRRARTCF